MLKDPYDSFQAGDLVYFIERRWMALCRIKKITRDQSRPNYAEYLLEILKLPIENERFQPLNTILKYFTVSHTSGVAYSGMWHFYTQEAFESSYSEYQTVMITWSRYVAPVYVLLAIALTIFLLVASGCFVLIWHLPILLQLG